MQYSRFYFPVAGAAPSPFSMKRGRLVLVINKVAYELGTLLGEGAYGAVYK